MWFRTRKDQAPAQTPSEVTEADRAILDSHVSKARAEGRWGHVHEATEFLTDQLETNHLAQRLEAAMTLRKPQ